MCVTLNNATDITVGGIGPRENPTSIIIINEFTNKITSTGLLHTDQWNSQSSINILLVDGN